MRTPGRALSVLAVASLAAGPFVAVGAAAAPRVKAQPDSSFAGYRVTKSKGKVTSAVTTFVVPTITCKKSFSGVGPSVLVLTKPDKKGAVTQSGVGVGVVCDDKVATYQALVIVNGVESNDYSIAPGDKMVASVKVASGKTRVDIKDKTSGDDRPATGVGNIGQTAMIGDTGIDFRGSVGIDPFTKTHFTDARVNNKPVGALGPTPVKRTHRKSVQIAVSKLTKKKDFTLTFKSSK